MIELEGRRYYETRDLEERFGRTRPTIWAWRHLGSELTVSDISVETNYE